MHWNMLRDDHDEPQASVQRFKGGISGIGGWNEDDRGIGILFVERFSYRIINRKPFYFLPAPTRRNASHQAGACVEHPVSLRSAYLASYSLDNGTCLFVK